LQETNNILNSAVSDQSEQKSVREIMEGIINLIVYLALGFMLIKKRVGMNESNEKIQ